MNFEPDRTTYAEWAGNPTAAPLTEENLAAMFEDIRHSRAPGESDEGYARRLDALVATGYRLPRLGVGWDPAKRPVDRTGLWWQLRPSASTGPRRSPE